MVINKNIVNWCIQNLKTAIDSLEESDADDFSLIYLDEIFLFQYQQENII